VVKRSPLQQGGTCPLSEIRATTISDAAGTGPITLTKQHAAKVWATIDQENSASSVKDSFNVSSITDGGTAKSTINFSNNMGNEFYSFSFGVCNGGGFNDDALLNVENAQLPLANNFKFYSLMAGALNAARIASVTIHGDLA